MKSGEDDKVIDALIQDIKTRQFFINQKVEKVKKKINTFETKLKKEKYAIPFLGHKYIGEKYEDVIPHGLGQILYEKSENIYRGEWEVGLRHGAGEYIYFDKRNLTINIFVFPKYIGEWQVDFNEGVGSKDIVEFKNLMKYEGEFTNNEITGFGTYTIFHEEDSKKIKALLIGFFYYSSPVYYNVELHFDLNGNLIKDLSGLTFIDNEKKTKAIVKNFKNIDEWESVPVLKKEEETTVLFLMVDQYFKNKLDIFKDEFKEIRKNIKKRIFNIQFQTYEKFPQFEKNKEFLKSIDEINKIYKALFSFDTIEKLNTLSSIIDDIDEDLKKIGCI